MPAITEYENKTDGLRPVETGIDATSQAARRVGAEYNELGAVVSKVGNIFAGNVGQDIKAGGDAAIAYADHQNISSLAASDAERTRKLNEAWNDTVAKADPNDPSVASGFAEKVLEPQLAQFAKGAYTEKAQTYAEHRNDALRTHFTTKMTADMSSLAATAAETNYRKTQNELSNTAMLDPSSVPMLLEQAKHSIGEIVDTSPNLKGVAGQKAKGELTQKTMESIALAGAIGAIRSSRDPEATANKWAERYPEYIDGAKVKALANEARTQNRLDMIEKRANDAEVKRVQTDNWHRAATQFENDTTRQNPETGVMEPVTPPNSKQRLNELRDNPGMEPGRFSSMVTRLESIGVKLDDNSQRNAAARSRVNQAVLFERTMSGEITDVKEYDKAYAKKDISWDAKEQLKRDFFADKSEVGSPIAQTRSEYIKAHEGDLDPARMVANLKSPEGSIAIHQATQALRTAEASYRKTGKNPQDLYQYDENTRTSPADAIVNKFRVPLSQLPGNLQRALGTVQTDLNAKPGPIDPTRIPNVKANADNSRFYDPAAKIMYDRAGNVVQ